MPNSNIPTVVSKAVVVAAFAASALAIGAGVASAAPVSNATHSSSRATHSSPSATAHNRVTIAAGVVRYW